MRLFAFNSKWRGWSCCISAPAADASDEACSDTASTTPGGGKDVGSPHPAAPVFGDTRKQGVCMPVGQQQVAAHRQVDVAASSPDAAAAAQQQQQWEQQQQAVVTATAASGSSTALTRDSLTTVAAVSGSSSASASPACSKSTTKATPSEQHHRSPAALRSPSTSRHCSVNASSIGSGSSGVTGAVPHQQQHQQQLVLPPENCAADGLHASCLQQLPSEMVGGRAGGGLSGRASCCATASSVAGFSESVVPGGAAALHPAASEASAGASAAGSDSKHLAGSSPAHSGQLRAPSAAAPAGDDNAAAPAAAMRVLPDAEPEPDSSDSVSLPPHLAARLRKMESGMSFRMLQAELSSEASTPAAAAAAQSSAGSGPVSRRSTAELLLQHPGSTAEPQAAPEAGAVAATAATLPGPAGPPNRALNCKLATVHSESLASRSAAGAASGSGSRTSSRHQRSGSSGSQGTLAGGGAGSSSAGMAYQPAAAGAGGPVGAVRRTLSPSSSPFAHLGFQHAVAASLAPQAHAAAGTTASAVPAEASRASGVHSSSSLAAAAAAAGQAVMLPSQGSVRAPSRVNWAASVAAQAQSAAVFQLLGGGGATVAAAAATTTEPSSTAAGDGTSDGSARILRPSKSMSSLQERPALARSSSSFVSRLQGLRHTKSSVAPRAQHHQPPVAAAAAFEPGSSNGAGGGRVQQSQSQVDSAPAAGSGPGTRLLRGILRRPANLGSISNSSSAAAGAVMAASGKPASMRVSLGNAPPSLSSTAGMAASAGLPPLPRPASAVSLDALVAAAGGRRLDGGSPFASRHALPADLSPASSSSTLPNSTSLQGQPGTSTGRPPAHSNGSSSLGQPSSSNGSGNSGGSNNSNVVSLGGGASSADARNALLISAAVSRMPPAGAAAAGASSSLPAPTAGQLPLLGSSDSFGSVDLASRSSVGGGVSSQASVHAAAAFAEAFVAALAAGDTKWASGAVLSGLLAEAGKMVGLDQQLYVGRAAIVRRLNGGMQQLVKMAGATAAAGDSGGDSSSHASTSGDAADSDAAGLAALASRMPTPQLSVSCPDPRARPSQAVAVYTFKWGIRKFTLRDEFIVKGGQILRLRRCRG